MYGNDPTRRVDPTIVQIVAAVTALGELARGLENFKTTYEGSSLAVNHDLKWDIDQWRAIAARRGSELAAAQARVEAINVAKGATQAKLAIVQDELWTARRAGSRAIGALERLDELLATPRRITRKELRALVDHALLPATTTAPNDFEPLVGGASPA